MPRKGVPEKPKAPGEYVSEPLKPQPDGYGAFGTWNPSSRYLFGTGTEIESRRPEAKYTTSPTDAHPHFEAIRPGATSLSANEPGPALRNYVGDAGGHRFGKSSRRTHRIGATDQ